MKKLWYKKYRPSTLEGFVFVDSKIQVKIEEWVRDHEFPHLLLAGAPGTGKCLDGTEHIDVLINIDTLSEEQISLLEKYKK